MPLRLTKKRRRIEPDFTKSPLDRCSKEEQKYIKLIDFEYKHQSGKFTEKIGIRKTESTETVPLIRGESDRIPKKIELSLIAKKVIFLFQSLDQYNRHGVYYLYSWRKQRRHIKSRKAI